MRREKLRIVVLGMMGRCPFAGQTWLYLNWLHGLTACGHDVWYIEDDLVWPFDPECNAVTHDCAYALRHLNANLARVGLADHWGFRKAYSDRTEWGPAAHRLDELYRSCDVLLNIVGATRLREEHLEARFRVYVETDPVTAQLRLAAGDASIRELFEVHHAMATYGENYGHVDCGVPLDGLRYVKTRQPIALELWPLTYRPDARHFTTVGNYRQAGADVELGGHVYRWSKHHEWEKFLALPSRTSQLFQLALTISDADRECLEAKGWRIVPAIPMSLDVFGAYRDFIGSSRAEFTVAKDQNVRLRSGWFSERDACYLASGKPVVAQDTGFGNLLPTGEGLFAFQTIEEAAAAVEAVNADYRRNCVAARKVAEEFFDSRRVAFRLLRDIGLT